MYPYKTSVNSTYSDFYFIIVFSSGTVVLALCYCWCTVLVGINSPLATSQAHSADRETTCTKCPAALSQVNAGTRDFSFNLAYLQDCIINA